MGSDFLLTTYRCQATDHFPIQYKLGKQPQTESTRLSDQEVPCASTDFVSQPENCVKQCFNRILIANNGRIIDSFE